MAISPPSDIVLDVARAAEPEKLEAARARLVGRAAEARAGLTEAFPIGAPGNAATAARPEATPATYRKFEAMVLPTFLQEMMPRQADSVFGKGLSGDMWKSLLSQQLGAAVANRGGIGSANHLLKDHYVEGDRKVALAGVAAGPEKVRHDQERNLSSALVNELQRRLTADIAGNVNPSASE